MISFIGLAYGLSWVLWIPAVVIYLRDPRITPLTLVLVLVGAYGPTFAAFLLTWRQRGGEGVRELLRRYLRVRVGWWWIGLAALVPVAVFFGGMAFKAAGGAPVVAPRWEQLTLLGFLGRVGFALPFGPLAEEAGWRGYLLPALQRRWSALGSSVVIGVVWTLWHIPMFWVAGAALPPTVAPSVPAVLVYMAGVVATAIIATALYNGTGGSLFIAVLYHLATNLWHQVLAPVFVGEATAAWADLRFTALAANWTVALLFIVILGPSRLSRREKVT